MFQTTNQLYIHTEYMLIYTIQASAYVFHEQIYLDAGT